MLESLLAGGACSPWLAPFLRARVERTVAPPPLVASMTEVNAEITQGETADEVMVTDGSTMFFSWRDGEGEGMFRAMGISDDAPSGCAGAGCVDDDGAEGESVPAYISCD